MRGFRGKQPANTLPIYEGCLKLGTAPSEKGVMEVLAVFHMLKAVAPSGPTSPIR